MSVTIIKDYSWDKQSGVHVYLLKTMHAMCSWSAVSYDIYGCRPIILQSVDYQRSHGHENDDRHESAC